MLLKKLRILTLSNISKILTEENTSKNNIPEDLSSCDLIYFKYSSISSMDVEQSFFRFKNIFDKNRHVFMFENLSKS